MKHKLVLGLGGSVDYEVAWEPGVIEGLARQYRIRAAEFDVDAPVEDERSLLCSILAFVRDGTGGERFVASSRIVRDFASRFRYRVSLGGNSVRAATAIAKLGVPSLVHLVSIDDNVRRLLPPQVDYLCSATSDSLHPHLIIQFPGGAILDLDGTPVRAPHPNRLIYVHDPPNRELVLSPDLPDALAGARAFLIGGFNAMRDPGLLRERMAFLTDAMTRLPEDAVVFYEDAGFHDNALRAIVSREFRDRVNVHSLNEDELQSYLGRRIDLLDAHDVQRALAEFRAYAIAPTVVVHTKYWVLAHGRTPDRYSRCIAGGIDLACTRYRHGDDFTVSDLEAIRQAPNHPVGAAFAEELAQLMADTVCCIPGRHLEVPAPTTIGLGDTFVGGFLAALIL